MFLDMKEPRVFTKKLTVDIRFQIVEKVAVFGLKLLKKYI